MSNALNHIWKMALGAGLCLLVAAPAKAQQPSPPPPIFAPVEVHATYLNPGVKISWCPGYPAAYPQKVYYNVYRSTTPGFTPSQENLAVGAVGVAPYGGWYPVASCGDYWVEDHTTYYYRVVATNGTASSQPSAEVMVTTSGAGSPRDNINSSYCINAGGGAVGRFVADSNFSGGGVASTTKPIDMSWVLSRNYNSGRPPTSIYQSERVGRFSYTFKNLDPQRGYSVALHFAEFYWTQPGQRTFNVSANGKPVLTEYDIIEKAGGPNRAIVEEIYAAPDAQGRIVLEFTSGAHDQAKVSGIELISGLLTWNLPQGGVAINAGAGPIGDYLADTMVSGGLVASTATPATTWSEAPAEVFQSERFGEFTYTIPNLAPGNHVVRLLFSEFYWTQAGQRTFHVDINGKRMLSDFDIIGEHGFLNQSLIEAFVVPANPQGQIVIKFSKAAHDLPKVSGIVVY